MYFKAFRPSPALSAYIRSYYYLCTDGESGGNKKLMHYPTDGSPKLVINLGDTFLAGDNKNNLKSFSGCRVLGSLTRKMVSKTGGRTAFIAIRFMPGKFASFFSIKGIELTNTNTALESLWGVWGKEFEQRLYNLSTIQDMLVYIESVLLKKLQNQSRFDIEISAALDMIWHTNGQIRVRDLSNHVGLSLRQFERRFSNLVGLYPKRLCRIIRFANIISTCDDGLRQNWVRKALEGGYSDHAHFIRECKFFTGLSPKTYLALRSPLEVAVWSKNSSLQAEKVGTLSSDIIKNPLYK